MLVYEKCECFVIQMYVCVVCASCGSSQCCILHFSVCVQVINTGPLVTTSANPRASFCVYWIFL